ncbi:MAG: hypothetical protein K0S61_122 [Anaerocolumna sp.]|jgi:hypothetical protein|nr:hypothetical protein [Anaerocolumna sp.]
MQLIGFLDGVEVSFDFLPPNTFTAEIPKQNSGVYILELHARDSAGNMTYYNNIFIKIDYLKLEVRIIMDNYDIIQNSEGFSYRQYEPIFSDLHHELTYSYRELIM